MGWVMGRHISVLLVLLILIPAAASPAYAATNEGDGVTVGVIDGSFDQSKIDFNDSVVAARAFGNGNLTDGNSKHGNGVAEVVHEGAPKADIALASINNSNNYRDAVEWLVNEQGVDIIVTSIVFLGERADGTGETASDAAWAADQGVLFVSAAGNQRKMHWYGGTVKSDNGWMKFDGSENISMDSVDNKGLTIYVRSQDPTVSYTSYLTQNGTTIDSSTTTDANGQLTVVSSDKRSNLSLAISAATNESRFNIFFVGGEPSKVNHSSSVLPPSTGAEVVGVGAYDPSTMTPRSFSSEGPQVDGDPGIDIIAPDGQQLDAYQGAYVTGTSFSAPEVAAAAARLKSKYPGYDDDELREVLYSTTNSSVSGDMNRVGNGTLDVSSALRSTPKDRLPNVEQLAFISSSNVTVYEAHDITQGIVFRGRLNNETQIRAVAPRAGTSRYLVTTENKQTTLYRGSNFTRGNVTIRAIGTLRTCSGNYTFDSGYAISGPEQTCSTPWNFTAEIGTVEVYDDIKFRSDTTQAITIDGADYGVYNVVEEHKIVARSEDGTTTFGVEPGKEYHITHTGSNSGPNVSIYSMVGVGIVGIFLTRQIFTI